MPLQPEDSKAKGRRSSAQAKLWLTCRNNTVHTIMDSMSEVQASNTPTDCAHYACIA